MRRIVVVVASLALLGSGATIALATGGYHGHPHGGSHQYKPRPGCGPDKNDGYAGKSGRHSGQPPKDHDRGDCPDPPGQCKDKGSYKSGYWWHHDSKPSWCKPDDRHCYHDKSSSKYKKHGKYYWWYGWDCSYKGKWYDKDKDHYHDDDDRDKDKDHDWDRDDDKDHDWDRDDDRDKDKDHDWDRD